MKKLEQNIQKLEKRLLKASPSDPYYKDEWQCLFDMKDALARARRVLK